MRPKAVVAKMVGRTGSFPPVWRYAYNLRPTVSHALNRPRLDGEAARVLDELNRSGIATTSIDRLLPNDSCFKELVTEVERLEAELANEMEAERVAAHDPKAVGKKTFIRSLLGPHPILKPDSVWARLALQEPLLEIANAYFGMHTKLRYYNVWHTFTTDSEARESQLWHRDTGDRQILKVFIYLSDVDDGAGPFTYARGSHAKGRLQREPDHFLEGRARRSTDEQMAAVVPEDRWLKAVGPAGTVVLADTRGYHKGGLARTSDRLLYMCKFTSQLKPQGKGETFGGSVPPSASTTGRRAFALKS